MFQMGKMYLLRSPDILHTFYITCVKGCTTRLEHNPQEFAKQKREQIGDKRVIDKFRFQISSLGSGLGVAGGVILRGVTLLDARLFVGIRLKAWS